MSNWLTKENAFLFRITHRRNLGFILEHGIVCRTTELQDENFVSIGTDDIIQKRDKVLVTVPLGGTLSDYIPFYFAPRSPMLYSIHRQKICPQEEVIYLVSKLQKVLEAELSFFFTDGHALMQFTQVYQDPKDLDKIDWEVMRAVYWNDTTEDSDRKRRRMAEFLVHEHFPVECIGLIAVKNQKKKKQVEQLLYQSNRQIPVKVYENWYY